VGPVDLGAVGQALEDEGGFGVCWEGGTRTLFAVWFVRQNHGAGIGRRRQVFKGNPNPAARAFIAGSVAPNSVCVACLEKNAVPKAQVTANGGYAKF